MDYSRSLWTPGWSEREGKKLVFPIVVKRALDKEKFEEIRRKSTRLPLLGEDGYLKADPYDYYAVLTNFRLNLATDKTQASEPEIKHKRYDNMQ